MMGVHQVQNSTVLIDNVSSQLQYGWWGVDDDKVGHKRSNWDRTGLTQYFPVLPFPSEMDKHIPVCSCSKYTAVAVSAQGCHLTNCDLSLWNWSFINVLEWVWREGEWTISHRLKWTVKLSRNRTRYLSLEKGQRQGVRLERNGKILTPCSHVSLFFTDCAQGGCTSN